VLTSDAPVITMKNGTDDRDDGNGMWCRGNGDQTGCALMNSRGILMDVWLLSQCDHYVYWRGSTSLLPLLVNDKLRTYWVGPPVTEIDWTTEFGGEDMASERKAHFRKWARTVDEVNAEYKHLYDPHRVLKVPVFGCPQCEKLLHDYGFSPVSPASWEQHHQLLGLNRIANRSGSSVAQVRMGGSEQFTDLLRMLEEGSLEQQWDVALGLGAMESARGDPAVRAALLEKLRHSGYFLQEAVLWALIRSSLPGDREVLTVLVDYLDMPAAARALPTIAPEGWCDKKVMKFLASCQGSFPGLSGIWKYLHKQYKKKEFERPAPSLDYAVEKLWIREQGSGRKEL